MQKGNKNIIKAVAVVLALSTSVGLASAQSLEVAATAASGQAAQAQWRQNMRHKLPVGEGCFKASFPAVRWEATTCRKVTGLVHPLPRLAAPLTVGNGNDYAIVAPGANLITQAVGSFPSVNGVTSESSVGVPAFGGGGVLGANEYTLQINTNSNSTTSACSGGAPGCTVWQQYLYAPDQLVAGSGGVFIQYWLLGYAAGGASCPGGYTTSGNSCYVNSASVEAPDTPITGLANLQLTGTATPGGSDTVTFFNGTMAYTVTASDNVLKIGTVWTQAEFNVVGDAGGSEAVFNNGSVIKVNLAAQYGSTIAPTCAPGAGTTGETNNLNLLPCTATGGATPNIQFIESLLSVPTISKAFSPTSISLGGNSLVTLTLGNPNAGINLTGAAFSDTLVGMSASGGAVGGTCTGTSPGALSPGATSLSFSGITIPAGSSCTVTFVVTGAVPGVFTNTASAVSSNEALTGNPSNTPTLTVIAPPVITKTFVGPKVIPGGTTTLNLSISNPNSFAGLPGVAFTDSLPAGIVVGTPNNLASSCGGVATATPGSGTVSLGGSAIAAGASCTVTVNVTGTTEGIFVNNVQVTSTNGGVGNTSSATLFVATPPNLSKTFGALSIGVGNTTSLSFTLSNPNHIVTLHALQFSDTLPGGLIIATPNGLSGVCDGGTITGAAGDNLITLTNATLAPQTSCTFSVNVTANGSAQGSITNVTSTVTSTEAFPGAAASATIFVGDPFQVTYSANLAAGDSFIDITNTGASGAALQSGTTATITGALCANVYAFTPDEQLVSCCSCPVTPNGLVSLSAKNDLASNTLTPAVPTALVVKVIASLPVGGSCNNSAAAVSPSSLANGIKGFGTTLHATPAAGTYGVTETPLRSGTLSAGELTRVTSLCNFILANGSGFGICRSCRLGGLGTDRQ